MPAAGARSVSTVATSAPFDTPTCATPETYLRNRSGSGLFGLTGTLGPIGRESLGSAAGLSSHRTMTTPAFPLPNPGTTRTLFPTPLGPVDAVLRARGDRWSVALDDGRASAAAIAGTLSDALQVAFLMLAAAGREVPE